MSQSYAVKRYRIEGDQGRHWDGSDFTHNEDDVEIFVSFDPAPEDGTVKPDSLMMHQIEFRSKVFSPQVYRVVDKLLRDGFLSDFPTHDGMRYRRNPAKTT